MLDWRAITVLAGAFILNACGPENTQTEMTLEEFKATVLQDSEGKFIVDGDQAFDSMEEVEALYKNAAASTGNDTLPDGMRQRTDGLAVYHAAGQDLKHSPRIATNLTYCVSSAFGANKAKVVQAMKRAAASWEASARVNFIHLPQYDAACTASQQGVFFDVRPRNLPGKGTLARAFFPNSARPGRNIIIDKTSFGAIAPITLTGVLRHELGHTLGFRHEHVRRSNSGCDEHDGNWRALTPYDAKSVMHYTQCKGTQTGDFVLTSRDKAGARKLYP